METYDLMRPKDLYVEVVAQREIDGRAFYDKHNKLFKEVLCPACGSAGIFAYAKYGFRHNRCESCGTLYVSPCPSDDLVAMYYANYAAPKMWTELLLKADTARKTMQYQPRVERIISVISTQGASPAGVAVDVGAGSGAFSICLKNTGFFSDVVAVDFSESCVRACRDQGLNAVFGRIETIESNFADLIVLNDIIEHVPEPLQFLTHCARVLRDGGFITMATPNGEGFDFKILREATKNITPPEHLNYFNPRSIEILLTRVGLKTMHVETPGKLDVDIIVKARKEGFSLKDNDNYLDYLLGLDRKVLESFQQFLSDNMLSSHMLTIARKI